MKKVFILCTNKECNEIPIINLIEYKGNFIIKTDCLSHHYKFEIEDYLIKIKQQTKEFTNICHKHNIEYDGYIENYNINTCKNCEILNNTKKIHFEFLQSIKINIDNSN